MGSSNTIEQQKKENEAFREYVDQQTASMQTILKSKQDELEKLKSKTFSESHITDQSFLFGGHYQHLETMSEWSLKNVAKIIDAVGGAIFGGPIPSGTKMASEDAVKGVATSLAGMEGLIADAAFAGVQALLGGLTSTTSTSVMSNTMYKQVAPGLFLFMTTVSNKYSHSSFFNNEIINETIYVFSGYSSKQAMEAVAGMKVTELLLKGYTDLATADAGLLSKVTDRIQQLDPTAPDFMATYQQFNNLADSISAKIKQIKLKIDKLHDKVAADAALARSSARIAHMLA